MMDVQSQQMHDKGEKHGYVRFFNNRKEISCVGFLHVKIDSIADAAHLFKQPKSSFLVLLDQ